MNDEILLPQDIHDTVMTNLEYYLESHKILQSHYDKPSLDPISERQLTEALKGLETALRHDGVHYKILRDCKFNIRGYRSVQ